MVHQRVHIASLLEGDSNNRYTYLLDNLATFNARLQTIESEVFGAVWTVGKGKLTLLDI